MKNACRLPAVDAEKNPRTTEDHEKRASRLRAFFRNDFPKRGRHPYSNTPERR